MKERVEMKVVEGGGGEREGEREKERGGEREKERGGGRERGGFSKL